MKKENRVCFVHDELEKENCLTNCFSMYGFFCLFLVLFSSFSKIYAIEIQTRDLPKPSFLESGERLDRIIGGKIFVAGSDYVIHQKNVRNNKSHTITRLYFTDGNGNVSKTVDLFPSNSKYKALNLMEDFEAYHCLYRTYEQDGKKKKDVLVLDNVGNQLWTGDWNNEQRVYWNDFKKQALVIYPNEGEIKIISQDGAEVLNKKFTENAHKKLYSDEDDDDDSDSFGCEIKASENGEAVLLNRYNGEKFNELILIDGIGNILFSKDVLGQTVHPVFVSEPNKICITSNVTLENGKLSKRWISGIDFNGVDKWEVDPQGYLIGDAIGGSDFVKMQKLEKSNHVFSISKTDFVLDLKTGKISKLK